MLGCSLRMDYILLFSTVLFTIKKNKTKQTNVKS